MNPYINGVESDTQTGVCPHPNQKWTPAQQVKCQTLKHMRPTVPVDQVIALCDDLGSRERDVATGLTIMATGMFTGAKLKEILNIRMQDLDTEEWMLHIVGRTEYSNRYVPIHPTLRPIIKEYLNLRAGWLDGPSNNSDILFPSPKTYDGVLSYEEFRNMKYWIEVRALYFIDMRDVRKNFAYMLSDMGVSCCDIGTIMGLSPRTSEQFHCKPDPLTVAMRVNSMMEEYVISQGKNDVGHGVITISNTVLNAIWSDDPCVKDDAERLSDSMLMMLDSTTTSGEAAVSATVRTTCEVLAKYVIEDMLSVYDKSSAIRPIEIELVKTLDYIEEVVRNDR